MLTSVEGSFPFGDVSLLSQLALLSGLPSEATVEDCKVKIKRKISYAKLQGEQRVGHTFVIACH